eukprot:TRINITY_DN65623_c0_g1_i1.p1 TRINITY_DN65623_c0_g1~~TRINITY_DN65623_c0_g1_i1.p1  ORF type:complete len:238 (-),score=48.78 TRINITY_DN65623_c0_g1_i1:151-864(-)
MLRRLASARAILDSRAGGSSPLLVAAENKRWAAVQLLLELRACLEGQDSQGRTALILAASHGHTKTLSSLMEHKAQLEARSEDGQTALIAAAKQRHWMAVRRLAEARANLEAVDSSRGAKPVLLHVAETSQWDTLVHLAKNGANLEVRGQGGRTVLMFAAECGLDDVAWWLLRCRANADAEDDKGETALLRSCNRQLEGMMRVLWEGGASVEKAVEKSRIPAMAVLLRRWSASTADE